MTEALGHADANEALAEGFNQLRRAPDSEFSRRKPTWRDDIFTAKELQQRQYPEIRWVIPSIIPEGLSILAGRPKIGKSWLALDIALAVADGTECMGGFLPEQGDVLYCALEDNERRLKKRIGKLLGNGTMWPDRLTITTRWKRLNDGGAHELEEWISSVHKPRLIILDTLAAVRPINTRDGYAQDYAALERVHRIANDCGIGIIVLHHQRKVEAQDPLDTISGTLGLAGCADTSLVLSSSSSFPGKTCTVLEASRRSSAFCASKALSQLSREKRGGQGASLPFRAYLTLGSSEFVVGILSSIFLSSCYAETASAVIASESCFA